MNKKIIFLISTLLMPVAAFAHDPGGALLSMGIVVILSLIISLLLLKSISRYINIDNKFLRFLALFFIEIGFLLLLYLVLSFIIGIFIYTHIFNG